MNLTTQEILGHRLRVHHLEGKLPKEQLLQATGVCGMQNSPPGAWETAMFQRLKGCTMEDLHQALYREKSLLQAWSYRGVPVVFPTAERDIYLKALIPQPGEEPWIYTNGIGLALDFLHLSFQELLPLVQQAASCLDTCIIQSKEQLDQVLAQQVEKLLPPKFQSLWNAPSMYGRPDRQTVGGAAVSFLLRPCSFLGLVVFGERQGTHPTFTSMKHWIGETEGGTPEPEKELTKKFLHAYGPTTPKDFESWLGAGPQQAKRLWKLLEEEITPVLVEGKTRFLLTQDLENLAPPSQDSLLLLGPHDPYLDLRDRNLILEEKSLQRQVWQTVSNPGVVLKGGKILGIWRGKTVKKKLQLSLTLWQPTTQREKENLQDLAEEYANFRNLQLTALQFQETESSF